MPTREQQSFPFYASLIPCQTMHALYARTLTSQRQHAATCVSAGLTHAQAWGMPPEHTRAIFSPLQREAIIQQHDSGLPCSVRPRALTHTHTVVTLSHTHTHTHTRCIESAGFEYDRPSNPSKCRSHYTAWLPVAVRNQ